MKFNTKDIITPKEGLVVYKNRYWFCENGDATKALFYENSPQCNSNILIQEGTLGLKMYQDYPNKIEIVFVETAFVPRRD